MIGVIPFGLDPDGPGPIELIDSIKISRGATLSSNIDAWGDVTTPFGTFASLRQMVTEETIDTTWTASSGTGIWEIIDATTASLFGFDQIDYDTTRTARWWTDNASTKFPIVEIDYNENGTANDVVWQKSTLEVAIAEESLSLSAVSSFPNPAKTVVTIQTDLRNNNSINVFDVTGKLIVEKSFNTNRVTLSTSDLDNGVYFYNVLDVNGNVLHSNKFVVAK